MQSDSYRNIYYVHKFNAHRSFTDDKYKNENVQEGGRERRDEKKMHNETKAKPKAKTLIINKRWYHFSTKQYFIIFLCVSYVVCLVFDIQPKKK